MSDSGERSAGRGVRIGINPLTWSNDDLPSLGADIALETCLSEAKEAGFEGMELGHKFPRDADVLAPIMRAHGLDLVSGWYSGRLLERSVEEEYRSMEPHLSLLEAMGSRVLIFAEVTGSVHGDPTAPISKRPALHPEALRQYGESLTLLAEHLLTKGMQLAYHHHIGTVIQTEQEIDELMKHTGEAVALLLDTGHLTYAGGDAIAVAERYGRRIRHVHLKDVRKSVLSDPQIAELPFLSAVLRGVFTVPGDGCVDFRGVLAKLAAASYSGWLVVEAEQDPEVAHPLTYAKLGHHTVSTLAREVGLI
jgi:inosose dehydratase